ncbi:Lachesin like protein [Argiope bruennichi]|uniref:Lachesin like protein n=1 Tax=Argiope bruennichi TaxID=94029 RepID=A0A8T0E1C6_ARGBR|nr:Lachesin like protein [Argiope bruennichi]
MARCFNRQTFDTPGLLMSISRLASFEKARKQLRRRRTDIITRAAASDTNAWQPRRARSRRLYSNKYNLVEAEPEFAEPIQNVTVATGRDAQLSCTVENLGTYRAAWIKVETKAILTIHHHIITRNYRISLSHSDNRNFILQIRNVQAADKGGYMCQINTVPMKSQVGYLDVLVPPDILDQGSSSDVVVREGANVTLTCKAGGYPTPNITWRREDNEPIPLGAWQGQKVTDPNAVTYEGEVLSITRVSRLHTGAYLCIAANGVPPSVSRRIILHVHFPPVLWIPNQLVGAVAGRDVNLDCHTEAYPASINYWGKRANEMIITNDKMQVVTKERTYKTHIRLTIKNLQPADFGVYKCFSKNSLGSTEGSVRLYDRTKEHINTVEDEKGTSEKDSPQLRKEIDEETNSGHPGNHFMWILLFLSLAMFGITT